MSAARLEPLSPRPELGRFRVFCWACGETVDGSRAVADRTGPAFRAFYCPSCAERPEAEKPAA